MKKLNSYLFICLLALAVGCQRTEVEPQGEGPQAKVGPELVVALQTDNGADYSLLTASPTDPNLLFVDKGLVAQSPDAAHFKVGNVLAAFTSAKDAVIGRIAAIEDQGGRYAVSIEPKDFASLFEKLDVDLSLGGGQPSKADNVVYPERIVEQTDADSYKVHEAQSRASWDIRFDYPFSCTVPLGSAGSVGVENGSISSQITCVLNLKISWFTLKNFEASIQGRLDVKAPVRVKFDVDRSGQFDKTFSTTIRTDKYWAVYKIAGIPLVVNFTPSVRFAGSFVANASADLKINLGVGVPFRVGAYFNNGSWDKVASATPDFTFNVSGVASPIALKGRLGVVPSVELGLFGLALGRTEVDGYATADLNAYVRVPDAGGAGELGASLRADGYVGGSIDLGLLPLGNKSIYRKEFTVFGPKQIVELSWRQPYSTVK